MQPWGIQNRSWIKSFLSDFCWSIFFNGICYLIFDQTIQCLKFLLSYNFQLLLFSSFLSWTRAALSGQAFTFLVCCSDRTSGVLQVCSLCSWTSAEYPRSSRGRCLSSSTESPSCRVSCWWRLTVWAPAATMLLLSAPPSWSPPHHAPPEPGNSPPPEEEEEQQLSCLYSSAVCVFRLILLCLVCLNFYLERKIYQFVATSDHPEHLHMVSHLKPSWGVRTHASMTLCVVGF